MADYLLTFDMDSFELGQHLGSGSFASVYGFSAKKKKTDSKKRKSASCLKRRLSASTLGDLTVVTDDTTSSAEGDESSSQTFYFDGESESIAHVLANKSLALKTLNQNETGSPDEFLTAVLYLQNEVRVLSSLPRHPNIITLYGTSEDFGNTLFLSKSTFIVLERLNESLDTSLRRWKYESRQEHFFRRRAHLCRSSQEDRLQRAAIGAARALTFLHSRQIMYRDLKPHNLGFDSQGNVRLFDFGLATPVEPGTDLLDRVGTLRYMAPEVASRQPYHLSADVYSFGMVLYEIVTLSKPFKTCVSKEELENMVTDPECHPTLQKVASPSLRVLLHDCRSFDRTHGRPTMAQVLARLQQEVKSDQIA